jgi:hypothetical protein
MNARLLPKRGRMRLRFFVLGTLILVGLAASYVLHVRWFGFPDGSLTELERAERAAFPFLCVAGIGLALAAFLSGARRSPQPRTFAVLVMLAVALTAGVIALDVVFTLTLDHGAGG